MTTFNFPWRPGMRTTTGRRLTEHGEGSIPPLHATPDRTDPATLGALLGVVREVRNAPHAYPWPNRDASEWAVYRETTFSQREPLGEGATEFDALIAACKVTP